MMRNVISYIAAMSASYGRHQEQVLSMQDVGMTQNVISYNAAMSACEKGGPEVPAPAYRCSCAGAKVANDFAPYAGQTCTGVRRSSVQNAVGKWAWHVASVVGGEFQECDVMAPCCAISARMAHWRKAVLNCSTICRQWGCCGMRPRRAVGAYGQLQCCSHFGMRERWDTLCKQPRSSLSWILAQPFQACSKRCRT